MAEGQHVRVRCSLDLVVSVIVHQSSLGVVPGIYVVGVLSVLLSNSLEVHTGSDAYSWIAYLVPPFQRLLGYLLFSVEHNL